MSFNFINKSFLCSIFLFTVVCLVTSLHSAECNDNQNVNDEIHIQHEGDFCVFRRSEYYDPLSHSTASNLSSRGHKFIEVVTPFIEVIRSGSVDNVRDLLEECGADPNRKEKTWSSMFRSFRDSTNKYFFCTPIGEACKRDNFEILLLLLERKGDPNQEALFEIDKTVARVGKPLQICAKKGFLYHIKLLLDYDANIDAGLGYTLPGFNFGSQHPLSLAFERFDHIYSMNPDHGEFLRFSEEMLTSKNMQVCVYLLLRGANPSLPLLNYYRPEVKEFNSLLQKFVKMMTKHDMISELIVDIDGTKSSQYLEREKRSLFLGHRRAPLMFWNVLTLLNRNIDIRELLIEYASKNCLVTEGELDDAFYRKIKANDCDMFAKYLHESKECVINNFINPNPTNLSSTSLDKQYPNLRSQIFDNDQIDREKIKSLLMELFDLHLSPKHLNYIDEINMNLFYLMIAGPMGTIKSSERDRTLLNLKSLTDKLQNHMVQEISSRVKKRMGIFLCFHPDLVQVLTTEANVNNPIAGSFLSTKSAYLAD